jgi:hypothetical protein
LPRSFGHKWKRQKGESPWSSSLSSRKLGGLLPKASSWRLNDDEGDAAGPGVAAGWGTGGAGTLGALLMSWWMLSAQNVDGLVWASWARRALATCSGVGVDGPDALVVIKWSIQLTILMV